MTNRKDCSFRSENRRAAFRVRRVGTLLALASVLTAACGGSDQDPASVADAETATSNVPSEVQGAGDSSDSWSADKLCDALDVDAIATLRGISVEVVENIDRSMFEDKVGVCHVMQDATSGGVRITVFDPSSARWLVNKGGGVKEPLEDQPRSQAVAGIGDRAVHVWNTEDRSSPQAAIYELVTDYDGVTVNIRIEGVEVDRSPEVFAAIAEQVRSDLGL